MMNKNLDFKNFAPPTARGKHADNQIYHVGFHFLPLDFHHIKINEYKNEYCDGIVK